MPWFGGAQTVTSLVKEVNENPSMDTFTAAGNASVKMKAAGAIEALVEPLKKHPAIKKADLTDCDITDEACVFLGELLKENHVIEELILEKNRISSVGAKLIADALTVNKGLRTLNLMQQATANFGEDTLDHFITMFNDNITLTKIMWRLTSRKSFILNKLQTRNVEIKKRLDKGEDFNSFLPDHLKSGAAAAAPAAVSADEAPAPVASEEPAAAPEPAVDAAAAMAAKASEAPATQTASLKSMEEHVAAVEAAVGELKVVDEADEAEEAEEAKPQDAS